MSEFDISPDQVRLRKSVYTQTISDTIYNEAEHIVKNYKKINDYWLSVQRRSVALCAFSLGVLFATTIRCKGR